ncbi:MAG: bifunctional diaminohydroxyphosphoribosylaminopyrimidine deaminase/5-amino-6-(5-phosphoribosylamino)uracil reductase RibD [Rhodospirillaceae bacterium]
MASARGQAETDAAFMGAALSLAARNIGDCWPNPSVGCVLVKDGVVVGRGWTASGGRPHAETQALLQAGPAARGATAYVTLEPCSHHGKTPPCADALVGAGVARVVSAVGDPDPRVSGSGLARLRAAGITVDAGVGAAEAGRIAAGYFLRVKDKRPLFALKTATTLDGRMALANGKSQWITGSAARNLVHALRARFDAILIGSCTALADDPLLTCRLDGYTGRPKVRVIVDRRLRLTETLQLVKTAHDIPTWLITELIAGAPAKAKALKAAGVDMIELGMDLDDGAFTRAAAQTLAQRGLNRVMIEGGAGVASAFLKACLIDEVAWFRAPGIMGGDGLGAVGPLGADDLARIARFRRRDTLTLGDDQVDFLDR